jgi:transposase
MIHDDVIGCDVAKAHLDFFDSRLDRHCRIDNQPAAIARWLEGLEGRTVHIVLEATGRYDSKLRSALEAAGQPYWRINPARARDFARFMGKRAKTDVIDARLLARLGESQPLKTQAPDDPTRHALGRLHARRHQLVVLRQQEQNRLHEAEAIERDSLERHITWLDREIADVEAACRAQLKDDEELRRHEKRLRSVPGIGPVTAMTLIAFLPELGTGTAKGMAALAGLAPFNVDSGTLRGQRHIGGGRKPIRDGLYMAAITASRCAGPFKDYAAQLASRGKPFKVIMIAIARKLLTIAHALIRDQTTYIKA